MNIRKGLTIALLGVLCASCTRVTTGEVGVLQHFNGTVSDEVLPAGFYTSILSKIYVLTVREVAIPLEDLKPTTKNNSSILSDLDVNIQYSINPTQAKKLFMKYRGLSPTLSDDTDSKGVYATAYEMVEMQAKSVVADAVSKFEAMEIGSKREELEKIIAENLQKDLNKSDPDGFRVSRVTISNLIPDNKIRDSLARITQAENDKVVASTRLETAKIEAEENKIRSMALSEPILAVKQMEMLENMAKNGNLIVVPMDFKGMINATPKAVHNNNQ